VRRDSAGDGSRRIAYSDRVDVKSV